jgi:hypothetical protein
LQTGEEFEEMNKKKGNKESMAKVIAGSSAKRQQVTVLQKFKSVKK